MEKRIVQDRELRIVPSDSRTHENGAMFGISSVCGLQDTLNFLVNMEFALLCLILIEGAIIVWLIASR